MKIYRRHLMLLGCSLLLLSGGKGLAAPPVSAGTPTHALTKPQKIGASREEAITSACSPDGKWFVLAGEEGTLRYCQAERGAVRRTFYHCAPQTLVFSADGRLLACAGGSHCHPGEIKVWDLESGQLLCTTATELAEAPKLALSPDGLWLVGTTGNARLSLWQIADGQSRWSVSLNRAVREVSFTRDGSAVVVRCADNTFRTLALLDGAILSPPGIAHNP